MIGKAFPFFMSNKNLGDAGYVYQVSSPSYNKMTFRPYITLTKVCDRTFSEKGEKIVSRENDVLFATLDDQYKESLKDESGVIDRSKVNWVGQVKRLINSRGTRVIQNSQRNGFPLVEITTVDLDIQKNLILNLRNNFRWRRYKFGEGECVDILYTPDTFAVYKLEESEDKYSLKPVGLYKNTDVALKNNLISGTVLETSEPVLVSKKIPDLMATLRDLESSFYDRDVL